MSSPRVWLITGASSGFGRAMTEFVLRSRDIVVATLRKPEVLSELSSRYPSSKLLVLKLDVSKPDEIVRAFAKAHEAFGRVDVVFNNAGIGAIAEVEGTPDEEARRVFEINFWGAANVSREAVRVFRDVNPSGVGGRLVQVTSMVGISAFPALGYYSASKFALEGLSESLAKEMVPAWNIRVIILALGGFRTHGTEAPVFLPAHPAYSESPAKDVRQWIQIGPSGGDINKAAREVYKVVDEAEPPLHFVLGEDSIGAARAKVSALLADTDAYESRSADLKHDNLN